MKKIDLTTNLIFFLIVVFIPAQAQQKQVVVDASQSPGIFELLIGTNCGPYDMEGIENLTQLYKDLGIKAIRSHDYYGPCDWYTIFPDWTRDAADPASYDFTKTDEIIHKIINGGFEVLFRLGPSWYDENRAYHNDPPGTSRDNQGHVIHTADVNDFNKFAQICKHIVMHYNAGWANGFNYGIKKWEVWNEPSVAEHFWSGTPNQFYQLFEAVINTLKSYDATLIIGGPGLAGTPRAAYKEDLLAYCAQNDVPLDFFSWHCYGRIGQTTDNSPSAYLDRAGTIRTLLDSYGYHHTLSICDEWNAGLNVGYYGDSGKGAAFYGCVLTTLVENNIAECYQYRGDDHSLGLVKADGQLRTATYTLKAWKMLTDSTVRLKTSGAEDAEFKAVASRSSDSRTLWVMLSNFSGAVKPVALDLTNIPIQPENGWTLTRYVISDTVKLEITETFNAGSGPAVSQSFDIQPESVQLLKFTPAAAGDGDEDSEPGKNCAIATASFGTPLAEEVVVLRSFRDKCLLKNPLGRSLVKFYYTVSPGIAVFIRDKEDLKTIMRGTLRPLIRFVNVFMKYTYR